MHLKRHQYVLIVVILALGAWNFWRMSRAHRAATLPAADSVAVAPSNLPRGTSPAWAEYDRAAAARDANPADWASALDALNASEKQAAGSPEAADLQACHTWLLFYRNEHLHPTHRPGFAQQTASHVDSCVRDHRDTSR